MKKNFLDFKRNNVEVPFPKTRKPGNYPAFYVRIEIAKTEYRRRSRQNFVAEVDRPPAVAVHSVAAPSSVENLRVRSVRVCL